MSNNIRIDQDITVDSFKSWVNLDLQSITWEGRFLNDFDSFWSLLFIEGSSNEEHFDRIVSLKSKLDSGPVISWLDWISDKFLQYLFVFGKMNIRTLSEVSNKAPQDVGLILRNFFFEIYPHNSDIINNRFGLNNYFPSDFTLCFEDFKKEINLYDTDELAKLKNIKQDTLSSLEITLYEDWRSLVKQLQRKKLSNEKVTTRTPKKILNRSIKFFKELSILFAVGVLIIFSVKVLNKYYEDYLIRKISLYVPNFFTEDRNINFLSQVLNPTEKKDIELSYSELEQLERNEMNAFEESKKKEQRFTDESDVVLTSIDSLPRDFDSADLEKSEYEESKKGGYRNSRYGRKKAYRIMMSSTNPDIVKNEIIKYVNYFKVHKADNVKPGTEIPGGIYFNLYVIQTKLKTFISKISSLEDSTILESKTTRLPPKGTNNVFIWIKKI